MGDQSDQELEAVLKEWKLESLVNKCTVLKFDFETLLEVNEGNVSQLTPHLGEQLRLLRCIRKHKQAQESGSGTSGCDTGLSRSSSPPCQPATGSSTSGTSVTSVNDSNDLGLFSDEGENLATCSTNLDGVAQASCSGANSRAGALNQGNRSGKRLNRASTTVTAAANKRLRCITESQSYEQLDLRDLLLKDGIGKCILQHFEEGTANGNRAVLSDTQRDEITKIIANFMLEVTDSPCHRYFPFITAKIKALFPTEAEETYYVSPRSEGNPTTGPIGKIPRRVRNDKSRRKLIVEGKGSRNASGSKVSSQSSKLKSNLPTILKKPVTDEVKGAATWLRHSRSPWPKVISQWVLTAPIRFKDLFQHAGQPYVNNYIEAWPVLSHKAGHELILEDFKLLYPAAENLLYDRWEKFVQTTVALAKVDVKDKSCKKLLHMLNSSLSQSNQASVILHILPAIRPAHTLLFNEKTVKVTMDDARDSYLVQVKVVGDVRTALKDRRAKLKGVGGQPLIVLVGPSEDSISVSYVSVAELLFRVDGVVEAIDLFFNSFHAFHTEYPPESDHILVTLQRGVYNFQTEWDTHTNLEHSWINSYKD